ncbi:hypothetical protein VT569_02860 [Flavobacterium psychrophilum]|uniref:hypothetical protein n=1 Tax=Flavobacterium psychrophilum TaxID=96345 RepID=UPI003B42EBC5
MKKLSNTIVILFVIIFSLNQTVNAQARKKAEKDTQEWRYEIEAIQTGTQGTYLIKVWSYSKRPDVAIEQAKKNAVHGIIFKGFAGNATVPGQSALTNNTNLEVEKEEFFKPFFEDGGKYMKFVSTSTDGAVAAEDRMKIGKEYKVGVIVSVNVSALRKDLEVAGILKSLNSGF